MTCLSSLSVFTGYIVRWDIKELKYLGIDPQTANVPLNHGLPIYTVESLWLALT